MRVVKWGASLAIRLPVELVEALSLKEGDEIEVQIAGERQVEITRNERVEKALEQMRTMRKPLPADWKFDRDEANSR